MEVNGLKLTIIIISYNTKELLRNCIKSIYENIDNIVFEIIVVDNASTDGSPEMVENVFKNTILIKNNTNDGFAKANNQAITIANGDYILLLNSDTIVRKNTVQPLVDFMKMHIKAAAVGPKVLNFDGTLQSKGHVFPSIIFALIRFFGINKIMTENLKNKLLSKFYWDENELRQVDWLSGCCLMIKKTAFFDIGNLSEDFFLYCEEVEWCYRARKRNYQIWYVPNAEINHLNRSSPFEKRDEAFIDSRIIFYKKTGIYKAIIVSLLTIIPLLIVCAVTIVRLDRKYRTEVYAQLRYEIAFLKRLTSSI